MEKPDLVYMNERIDFITKLTEKMNALFIKLTNKDNDTDDEFNQLKVIYKQVNDSIDDYYLYLASVNIKAEESYLTIWLYEYNNIEIIKEIGHFIEP